MSRNLLLALGAVIAILAVLVLAQRASASRLWIKDIHGIRVEVEGFGDYSVAGNALIVDHATGEHEFWLFDLPWEQATRVRTLDTHGQWSAWSEPLSVCRRGDLTRDGAIGIPDLGRALWTGGFSFSSGGWYSWLITHFGERCP